MVHISQRTVRRMQLRKQDAHIRRQDRLASERLQRMMDQFVSEVRSDSEVRSKHSQISGLDIPQMTFGKPDNEPWHYDFKTLKHEMPKKRWVDWKLVFRDAAIGTLGFIIGHVVYLLLTS